MRYKLVARFFRTPFLTNSVNDVEHMAININQFRFHLARPRSFDRSPAGLLQRKSVRATSALRCVYLRLFHWSFEGCQ